MPLAMTRPYPHPRTGVYWLRKVVPTNLRAAVGKRELVQSLGTKSPREAREKAPQFSPASTPFLTLPRRGSQSWPPRTCLVRRPLPTPARRFPATAGWIDKSGEPARDPRKPVGGSNPTSAL
jgi:hypothetical protein